jgi:transcriptional regulator with XRE-family HTH domain
METLQRLRKEAQLTRKELSEKIGCTENYIYMIENGHRRPSPEVAQRLGEVLGFDWTIFFSDNPPS